MSTPSQTVTVFSYWVVDRPSGRSEVSATKAPLNKIRLELGAVPLLGTASEVEVQELDEAGLYRRYPTGWLPFLASSQDT